MWKFHRQHLWRFLSWMKNKNLEIYIHIPFCVRKCAYCDFLSAPANEETYERYVNALINEIKLNKVKMEGYKISSIFIGGGTPSILKGDAIANILSELGDACSICDNAEITIECNPGTVDEDKLLAYKKAGINRISFGLQSANDEELKKLGRIHTYEQFLDSYNMARKCDFKNINIDIMSALPNQTKESYIETLNKVIALNPEHISAYSLIVEEETPMYDWVENGQVSLPSEDDERQMYYDTKDILAKAGYRRYEISNYSKPGFECKHNIGYWQRADYLGFGIGAASLFENERFNNTRDLNKYLDNQRDIREDAQMLSLENQMEEYMFLGLRMCDGVSIKKFESQFGKDIFSVYQKVIDKFVKEELLEIDGDMIKLTPFGNDISNYVMSEFLLED